MLLQNQKLKLNKIISMSAVALTLAGIGEVATSHTTNPPATTQTVKAATVNQSDIYFDDVSNGYTISDNLFRQQLFRNGEEHLNTWKAHNSVSVHWYRKPQFRSDWPNTDVTGDSIDFSHNQAAFGYAWVIGTIKVNGRTMYLTAYPGNRVTAEDTANINKKPKFYAAKNITLYSLFSNSTYDYGSGSSGIMVPYYHKPVTLPDAKTGKLNQYVPVFPSSSNVYDGCYLITVSDFNRTIRRRQPSTIWVEYKGYWISEHRGHINASSLMKHNKEWRAYKRTAYNLTKSRRHRTYQKRAIKDLEQMFAYHKKHGFE